MMKLIALVVLVAVAAAAPGGEKQMTVDAPPPSEYRGKQSPPLHKGKRQTCGIPTTLAEPERTESVYAHNLFRGKEPASNMQKLVWDDEMAAVAQAWANQCKWEHGGLYDCKGDRIGQNLFVEASAAGYPKRNMTGVIEAWNNERYDWNFDTGKCADGKLCGHWTQLVHAKSTKVGCAFAQCPTMNVAGQVWKNALYVVCDYTPPGNVMGEPFYLKGSTCSNCDSDATGKGYKCADNLCTACTPSSDAACKCGTPLTCANGGAWSAATCSCTCAKGFYGQSCDKSCTCADTSENCSAWKDYCKDAAYADFMNDSCKTTCGFACNLPKECS